MQCDLGNPHSSVTRSQFRTLKFLIMNPAKILQELKTLEEALKTPLELEDLEEAPDYDPNSLI